MNWKELKEFCDTLNAEQLEKEVVLWREDEGINDISAEQLQEDHYNDPEDTEAGCFPINDILDGVNKDALKKVYDKGHPILFENF